MAVCTEGKMGDIVFGYQQIPANSWAYLSSLLMIALFFKFNRVWALRNYDLVFLILLAPGLLMVYGSAFSSGPLPAKTTLPAGGAENSSADPADKSVIDDSNLTKDDQQILTGQENIARDETKPPPNPTLEKNDAEPTPLSLLSEKQLTKRNGFIWIFGVGLLLLIRMLLDPLLIRRPQLEPNLSSGGLVFLGLSMLSVSIANVIVTTPSAEQISGAESGVKMVHRVATTEADQQDLRFNGPGYVLFHALVVSTVSGGLAGVAKALAIAGQIALVVGLVYVGHFHFNNFRNGVGVAVLYLMLPYTSLYSGHVMHLLPAALLVWAVALYRYPIWSGVMIGLATGVSYYPVFLLPLWVSFYWDRGYFRFIVGTVIAIAVCIGGLIFTSTDLATFMEQLQRMFGFWLPRIKGITGIWALGWDPWFRLPVMVAYLVLSVSFVFWPLRKNVGTLIAFTSALMVAVQFWHGYEGGTHMAWYLPLCLLVFFRPNLSERFANTEVRVGRRRLRVDSPENVISAA